MSRKYYSINEKNTFSSLLDNHPGIRDALEKLTEDSCFTTLTNKEKELLNMFGFKAIMVDTNVGSFDHLDYNTRTFLGYLYELNVAEYMKVHSVSTNFNKVLAKLTPLCQEMANWKGDDWPYVTILRNDPIESQIPHHEVFGNIPPELHLELEELGNTISKLTDTELKVLWLLTYTSPTSFRIIGYKDRLLLVKSKQTRLGLFID